MNWKIRFRYVLLPKILSPFRAVGNLLGRFLSIYSVVILLTFTAGALWYFYCVSFDELVPNLIPELLSIVITVLIIDTLYKKRSDSEVKKILISQLQSRNNAVATNALKEIDARGWLSDGTLKKAFLISTNLDGNSLSGGDLREVALSFSSLKDTSWFETDLEGAFLNGVDLRNATLSMHATGSHYAEANLRDVTLANSNLMGAIVRDEQLIQVRSLWRATMPDGTTYDGRYNLSFDKDLHLRFANDPNDPSEWSQFYGVPVTEYLQGQAWAKANSELLATRDSE